MTGDLWFTESNADQIGRIAIDGGITEFNVPTEGALVLGIAVDSRGLVWFAEERGNKIGIVDAGG